MMIEYFESSKISSIAKEENFKHQLPFLIAAPDMSNVNKSTSVENMPKLTPAPKIARKRDFDDIFKDFAYEKPMTLDDMIVPIKRKKATLENNELIEKLPMYDNKIFEGNVADKSKIFKKPRTKITSEIFSQISNMGFSINNSQSSFKCFSKWCNFKAKSNERFQEHLRVHHQHEASLESFDYCNSCKKIINAENLDDEFEHMITFHLNKMSLNDGMKESKKETTTSGDSVSQQQVKTKDTNLECLKMKSNETKTNANDILHDYLKNGPVFKSKKPESSFVDGEVIELIDSEDEKTLNLIIDEETITLDEIEENLNNMFSESDLTKNPIKSCDFEKIETLPEINESKDDNKVEEDFSSPTDIKFSNEDHTTDLNKNLKNIENSNSIIEKPDKSEKETEKRTKRKYKKRRPSKKTSSKKHCTKKSTSSSDKAMKLSKIFRNAEIVMSKKSETPRTFKRSISLQKQIDAAKEQTLEKVKKVGRPRKHQINEERSKFIDKLIIEEKSVMKKNSGSSASTTPTASPVMSPTSYLPKCSSSQFVYVVKPIEKKTIVGPKAKKSFPNNIGINQKRSLEILNSRSLMEWQKVTRSNEKYEIVFENMKRKYSLISLYKCMGRECSYTTNLDEHMLHHLNVHESERIEKENQLRKRYEPELKEMRKIKDFYLYCAYCMFKTKESKALVHHINDIHRKDIYQCGYCFYRSCSKRTCFEHCKDFHRCFPNLIYECPEIDSYQAANKGLNDRLIRKRAQFVAELRCKLCEVGYYAVAPYLKHIEEVHSSEDQQAKCFSQMSILEELFKQNVYGMFQCLYCVYGDVNEEKMCRHLTEHPSEFAFTCKREPPKYVDQNEARSLTFYYTLASTSIINLEKNVQVEKFTEDIKLLNNLDYNKTIDDTLQSKM